MNAAYQWQCSQLAARVHPSLLVGFSGQDVRDKGGTASLHLGHVSARTSQTGPARTDSPIQDADVVPLCLTLRSLSKTNAIPPLVYVDFAGEPIGCEGAKTLAAVLQVGCGITSLSLRRTRVSDNGAAALGSAVFGSSLMDLDIGECLITDVGLRLLVRGMRKHGAPASLSALLLDGNPIGNAGIAEMISLIEGPSKPSGMTTLSLQPAQPGYVAPEVEAALRVVCQLAVVELRPSGWNTGGISSSFSALDNSGNSGAGFVPSYARGFQTPQRASGSSRAKSQSPRSSGGISAIPRQVSGQSGENGRRGVSQVLSNSVELPPGRNNSSHLATWMASTERELRELKWLLGSTAARLDGQHAKLVTELGKVQGQLDTWMRSGGGSGPPTLSDERRLDVLETRFDALERLVGREQSECAQMWQIVEAAAGVPAPDVHAGGQHARVPPSLVDSTAVPPNGLTTSTGVPREGVPSAAFGAPAMEFESPARFNDNPHRTVIHRPLTPTINR